MPFTYAIADLHGRYDLLSEAVTKIVEHSKSDRPATIITLGDYVDRGPSARDVIELALDLEHGNAECVYDTLRWLAPKLRRLTGQRLQ